MPAMREHVQEQCPPNKKPRFPVPDGFALLSSSSRSRAPAQPPQSRRVPNFRSDFALSHPIRSDLPHGPNPRPSKQKQTPRARARPLGELLVPPDHRRLAAIHQNDVLRSRFEQDALVPKENVPTVCPTRVLSPPPHTGPSLPVLHASKSTKIMEPPRLSSPPPRPSTPPRNLTMPDLSKFLSPSDEPPRPSKPVSRTRIALATDLWTEGGRADLLGLTLEQHGVPYATPTEKAIRRGLEVSPRKAGIGKEIRYARGGLAEQASKAIGKRTTALSLWRRSIPSPESASMLVQIEEILNPVRPPPQRGSAGMLLCLARCRARREDDVSMLVLFSVPPHDAKNIAMWALEAGRSVALWEPLLEVEISSMASRVYLCSRFVLL